MNKQKGFGVVEALVISIVIAIICALGFVVYNTFFKKNYTNTENVTTQNVSKNTDTKHCKDDGNEAATNGVFCSESMKIRFVVPAILNGRITREENHLIEEGPIDQPSGNRIGKSDDYYFSRYRVHDSQIEIWISREAVRSHHTTISHEFQPTYFNKDTGELNKVIEPIRTYNSQTDEMVYTGTYHTGDLVPSVMIDGVRFFKAIHAEAGLDVVTYLGVIESSLIQIEISHHYEFGVSDDHEKLDREALLQEFDNGMKQFRVL